MDVNIYVLRLLILDYTCIALDLTGVHAPQPSAMYSTHLGEAQQPFYARTLTTHQLEVEKEGTIEPITLRDD